MSTKRAPNHRRQELVIASDGLPALAVGPWAEEKLYFLSYFTELFNGGMKYKWPLRAYIDLFSGPGMCAINETSREIAGSPLCALKCGIPFTHLFFNDVDSKSIEALRERTHGYESEINYYEFDCNEAIEKILRDLPTGALGLGFIDPWNWEITFESVYKLTEGRAMDLIIIFHTGSIKRNAHRVLQSLDSFIGDSLWRDRYLDSFAKGERRGSRIILDHYEDRLRNITGYRFVNDSVLVTNSGGTPLYHLIYASRSSRGEDFWNKSISKTSLGQHRLF